MSQEKWSYPSHRRHTNYLPKGARPPPNSLPLCPPIQYLPCNPYSLKECNKRSRLSDKTDDCFVSRPARVRQTQDPQLRRLLTYFDSRTRDGCDPPLSLFGIPKVRFNSRTREGCDPVQRLREVGQAVFQFTHPRGVRHGHTYPIIHLDEFQFTHPRGVRRKTRVLPRYTGLFQFTHPRGVATTTVKGGA